MTPPLLQKVKWMKVKEESEKFGLKLNIQKTKIMASGPITSWEGPQDATQKLLLFINNCDTKLIIEICCISIVLQQPILKRM